ncbi:hypothetical protein G9A89_003852 [Geosiphon pyriformis]|nr:hypothetical protein G9A89_003852 [Geosiphon pyriformis]
MTILGLYMGATLKKRLAYLHVVNLIVAKTLNNSTFVVFGGDFNENNSGHSDGGLVKSAVSSRFHKLKLLVAKILEAYKLGNLGKFQVLVNKWVDLDFNQTVKFKRFLDIGYDKVAVIAKHIEAFVNNKGQMIRSVLKKSFRKVILDYLVNNEDLVLEPDLVKDKVDSIIENWTRKHTVKFFIPSHWQRQFAFLDYVNNDVFSGVMKQIDSDKFLSVIKNLPNGKAAGLSDIFNELWKHYNKFVLVILLCLFNLYLVCKFIPNV